MAGKFKYIKKAIITITKGPRKGQKELRYFYKGDKIPKSVKVADLRKKLDVVGTRASLKRTKASLKRAYARRGAITAGTRDHTLWLE